MYLGKDTLKYSSISWRQSPTSTQTMSLVSENMEGKTGHRLKTVHTVYTWKRLDGPWFPGQWSAGVNTEYSNIEVSQVT